MAPTTAIRGLLWSDEAERHIEAHIQAWEVDELIEGGDFFAFPNTGDHPPNRWKVIGRTPAGTFITAILQEPAERDPLQWLPITGWSATPYERQMYQRERQRRARKSGGSHAH